MATGPQLKFITLVDKQSFVTAASFASLQQNIQNFGNGFLPLVGGTMEGAVQWSPQQLFPGSQVPISNPSYKHSGFWRTLSDHVADASVHNLPGPPQIHVLTHEIGGSDALYGSLIAISPALPGESILTYINSSFAAATAAVAANYAPAARYEIGGATPIYGNLLPISAASGSTSVKSYVDLSITNALSGPFPQNPSFNTITMAGTASYISWTASNINLISMGNMVLYSPDGDSLVVAAPNVAGAVKFGDPLNPTAFGIVNANGYSIGSTNIGPNSAAIAGSLTAAGDLELNRSSTGASTAAGIGFGGSSTNAVLTYNVDVPNGFYLSKSTTIGGLLSLSAGNQFIIAGAIQIGPGTNPTLSPSIRADGTNLFLNAINGGQVYIGFDNAALSSINLGPSSLWGNISSSGLAIGSSTFSASGATVAGTITINGGYSGATGDIGVARTSGSGQYNFGQSTTSAYLEYGVASNNFWSYGTYAGGVVAQIKADGSYSVGSTLLGPTALAVNGAITAQQAVYAGTGITANGANGFTFTGDTGSNTGLFSNGGADLRLMTTGVQALSFLNTGTTAVFGGNVNIPGLTTSQSLSVSGNAIVGGSLTLNQTLYGGGNAINKFRVKDLVSLGYYSGAADTGNNYPNLVIPAYTGGQIEVIRISTLTPDSSGGQTTFTIYKNLSVIGTIALTSGGTTSSSFPITNPTPIVAGDQVRAVMNTAGTATGVAVSLEISQFLY